MTTAPSPSALEQAERAFRLLLQQREQVAARELIRVYQLIEVDFP